MCVVRDDTIRRDVRTSQALSELDAAKATLAKSEQHLAKTPAAKDYFYQADGSPKPVGTMLVNRPLADTLRAIAQPILQGLGEVHKRGVLHLDIKPANIYIRNDSSPVLNGVQAECIKMNGALELAPALGLCRRIVDLVASGRTLKENGLVEIEHIADVTSRFIVNRAALKTQPERVGAWIDRGHGRLLMTGGSVLAAALLLLWSQIDSLPMYYLMWIGLGACQSVTLYEPAFAVITRVFGPRYKQAILIMTFLGGLASTFGIPFAQLLIERIAWRPTLEVMAAIILGVGVLIHWLFVPGPREKAVPIGAAPRAG